MIRRILSAVDGSVSSLAGVKIAADWASRLEAGLLAVFVEEEQRFVTYTVSPMIDGGVYPIPLPPDKLAAEQQKVAEERRAIQEAFDQIAKGKAKEARFVSIPGATNEVLIREARQADLVVIGKRGRFDPPMSRQAGPTTESIIQNALRPVLVMPDRARTEGPALIAYDDSRGVQRVLPFAVDLAERLNWETIVVTVNDKAENALAGQALVKPYLLAHRPNTKFVVEKGRAAEGILRIAERERAGLIAMGAFGGNPIYELFFGSTTLSVLERAECPVLLMA
jgi:nucleotide-binding universal stress UspA family protein